MLEYQGKHYHLNAGKSDIIHVFTENVGLYVLTINSNNKYIRLDAFMLQEQYAINSIFLHSEHMVEILGTR